MHQLNRLALAQSSRLARTRLDSSLAFFLGVPPLASVNINKDFLYKCYVRTGDSTSSRNMEEPPQKGNRQWRYMCADSLEYAKKMVFVMLRLLTRESTSVHF